MKLFLGSDHAGFVLKSRVLKNLAEQKGLEIFDCGCFSNNVPVDYPDVAIDLCRRLLSQKAQGVLFCGTGVGMAIAANKVEGIRAVCGVDYFSVEMARRHNDVNVLCLGERVVGLGIATMLVKVFLNTPFDGGRHKNRVEKLKFN